MYAAPFHLALESCTTTTNVYNVMSGAPPVSVSTSLHLVRREAGSGAGSIALVRTTATGKVQEYLVRHALFFND